MSSSVQENVSQILLTDHERDSMTVGPSISTITFLKGGNKVHVESYFKDRLQSIVDANPWLSGRLVKNKKERKLTINYNSENPSIKDIFITPEIVKNMKKKAKFPIINSTMNYINLCDKVGGSICELPAGDVQISKKLPLMALSIVPDSVNSDTFAIIISISHVIIDGYTYYKILSMFNSNVKIESLNAIRKSDLKESSDKAIGLEESKFVYSGSVMCNVICTMLCSVKKPMIESYLIDNDKINQLKEIVKSDNSDDIEYVSTNDICASSFGNVSGSKVLLVPINWRNKISNFNNNDAGNYEGALVFSNNDFYKANLIRKTLQSGPPVYKRNSSTILPSGWSAARCKLSMCVSWCFDVWDEMFIDMDKKCGEQVMHIPISSTKLIPFECALIYKPKKNMKAITFFTRTIRSEGLMKGMPIGKNIICPDSMIGLKCK